MPSPVGSPLTIGFSTLHCLSLPMMALALRQARSMEDEFEKHVMMLIVLPSVTGPL